MHRRKLLILVLILALILTGVIVSIVLVLSAKTYFKVEFDDGNCSTEQVVKKGDIVEKPKTPMRDGYEFVGWFVDGGDKYDFTKPVYENLRLVAKWVYTRLVVRFDSNGGTPVPLQVVDYGGVATKPFDPQYGYRIFEGWFKEKDDVPYDFSLPVSENFTLVARWKNVFVTVSFDSDGGSVVPAQSVEAGECASAPQSIKDGFELDGWATEDGSLFDFNTPVTQNITLKAVWKVQTFSVTFFTAGGSDVSEQIVERGGKAGKPSCFRFGYIFLYWLVSDTDVIFDFDSPITKNISLVAAWEETNAFDNLLGVWSGTSDSGTKYSLKLDKKDSVLTKNGTDCKVEVFTSSVDTVVLRFEKQSTEWVFFRYDGYKLKTDDEFCEKVLLVKESAKLVHPAELAGVWECVVETEVFGEKRIVRYVLDIKSDGMATLRLEIDGNGFDLQVEDISVRNGNLVVKYREFKNGPVFEMEFYYYMDELFCMSGAFEETIVLRKKT